MATWIEIARHPEGYVLSRQSTRKKRPLRWTRLQLTHPDWDQSLRMTWMAERQQLSYGDSSMRLMREQPEIKAWVIKAIGAELYPMRA